MKKITTTTIAAILLAGSAFADEQTARDEQAINAAFHKAIALRNNREQEPGMKGRAWAIGHMESIMTAFVRSGDASILNTRAGIQKAIEASDKAYPSDREAKHIFFRAAIDEIDEIVGELMEEKPLSLEDLSEEFQYRREQLQIK